MANDGCLRMIAYTVRVSQCFPSKPSRLPSSPLCPCLEKGLSYILSFPSDESHVVTASKVIVFSVFLHSFFVIGS